MADSTAYSRIFSRLLVLAFACLIGLGARLAQFVRQSDWRRAYSLSRDVVIPLLCVAASALPVFYAVWVVIGPGPRPRVPITIAALTVVVLSGYYTGCNLLNSNRVSNGIDVDYLTMPLTTFALAGTAMVLVRKLTGGRLSTGTKHRPPRQRSINSASSIC